jgi:hypothetical protein
VRFLAHEDGNPAALAFSPERHTDLHANFLSDGEESCDELVETDTCVSYVDEHIHEKLAADDALLDVFDINVAFCEIGAYPSDDAFLIASEDAHDGKDTGHVGASVGVLGPKWTPAD